MSINGNGGNGKPKRPPTSRAVQAAANTLAIVFTVALTAILAALVLTVWRWVLS